MTWSAFRASAVNTQRTSSIDAGSSLTARGISKIYTHDVFVQAKRKVVNEKKLQNVYSRDIVQNGELISTCTFYTTGLSKCLTR